MLSSATPPRFQVPFANAAGGPYITTPVPLSPGTPGRTSLQEGFPPLNFTPRGAGGIPPFGEDMNGVLYQITQWLQWQAAGAPIFYNSAFATAIGGYPKGAVLSSSVTLGLQWLNGAENNLTDPDGGGAANWTAINSKAVSVLSGTGYIQIPNSRIYIQWVPYSITPSLSTDTPPNTKWGQVNVNWPLTFNLLAGGPFPQTTFNGQFAPVSAACGNSVSTVFATCWDDPSVGTPLIGFVIGIGII